MTGPAQWIKGLVIPSKWDETGRVTAVIIASHEEIDYQVEENASSMFLINHLHQPVEIKGWITETGAGLRAIEVLEFRLMDRVQTEIHRME